MQLPSAQDVVFLFFLSLCFTRNAPKTSFFFIIREIFRSSELNSEFSEDREQEKEFTCSLDTAWEGQNPARVCWNVLTLKKGHVETIHEAPGMGVYPLNKYRKWLNRSGYNLPYFDLGFFCLATRDLRGVSVNFPT